LVSDRYREAGETQRQPGGHDFQWLRKNAQMRRLTVEERPFRAAGCPILSRSLRKGGYHNCWSREPLTFRGAGRDIFASSSRKFLVMNSAHAKRDASNIPVSSCCARRRRSSPSQDRRGRQRRKGSVNHKPTGSMQIFGPKLWRLCNVANCARHRLAKLHRNNGVPVAITTDRSPKILFSFRVKSKRLTFHPGTLGQVPGGLAPQESSSPVPNECRRRAVLSLHPKRLRRLPRLVPR
jgi:hypothetical protein